MSSNYSDEISPDTVQSNIETVYRNAAIDTGFWTGLTIKGTSLPIYINFIGNADVCGSSYSATLYALFTTQPKPCVTFEGSVIETKITTSSGSSMTLQRLSAAGFYAYKLMVALNKSEYNNSPAYQSIRHYFEGGIVPKPRSVWIVDLERARMESPEVAARPESLSTGIDIICSAGKVVAPFGPNVGDSKTVVIADHWSPGLTVCFNDAGNTRSDLAKTKVKIEG